MNTLKMDKKIQVLKALTEGNSIRSTERMFGVHRDTIMRLLVRTGHKCQTVMDDYLRGFHCKEIEADEVWSYVAKKENRLTVEEKKNRDKGDQYIFIAIDPRTKAVPCFIVGKRELETTYDFISELHKKVSGNGQIQITTDGFRSYQTAIEDIFGLKADFAQLIKVYGAENPEMGRYSPPKILEAVSKIILGNPNPKNISTSYIERQNLTLRMQMRRLTRLTNGFSKKLENLKAALSVHFWHYNFSRVHSTLRVTPFMQAKLTDHIWEWEELLKV